MVLDLVWCFEGKLAQRHPDKEEDVEEVDDEPGDHQPTRAPHARHHLQLKGV